MVLFFANIKLNFELSTFFIYYFTDFHQNFIIFDLSD